MLILAITPTQLKDLDILEWPWISHLVQPNSGNKISSSVTCLCLVCWDCLCAADIRHDFSVSKYRDLASASPKQDSTEALFKRQVKKSNYLKADKPHHQSPHRLLNNLIKVMQSSIAITSEAQKGERYLSLCLFCQRVLLWRLVFVCIQVHWG